MGHFKLKAKRSLDDLTEADKIEESDFCTITPQGNFIQLEYIDESEEITTYDVKPGVYVIQASPSKGFYLEKTSFVKDSILKEFLSTKDIVSRVKQFFNRLDVYYKHGFEVPKRAGLLFGPPGSGKTSAISEVVEEFEKDGKTIIIVWPTDKFKAYQVKEFIKSFNYTNGVDKMIFIAEDVGGIEYDQGKMESDSGLLSLLDNQEKTFKMPVYILATTNFPETMLGNITNRPNRFDDKIKVGFPNSEQREALYKFFMKFPTSVDLIIPEDVQNALKYLKSKECEEFTPAHIREVIIRAELHDKTTFQVMKEQVAEIKHYKNEFKDKRGNMSILSDD